RHRGSPRLARPEDRRRPRHARPSRHRASPRRGRAATRGDLRRGRTRAGPDQRRDGTGRDRAFPRRAAPAGGHRPPVSDPIPPAPTAADTAAGEPDEAPRSARVLVAILFVLLLVPGL